MNKIEARKFAKAQISKMSSAQKEWASGAIADALSGLFEFTHAPKVFVYLGTDGEPNTEEIVGLALMLEKVVCVPRVCGAPTCWARDCRATTGSRASLPKRNP